VEESTLYGARWQLFEFSLQRSIDDSVALEQAVAHELVYKRICVVIVRET